MRKDIAEKWVKALRSGDYKQGENALNSNGSYCCLGVLCEIGAGEGIIPPGITTISRVLYDNNSAYLPDRITRWAQIRTWDGEYSFGKCLAGDNDTGKTFSEIADIIEAHIDDL